MNAGSAAVIVIALPGLWRAAGGAVAHRLAVLLMAIASLSPPAQAWAHDAIGLSSRTTIIAKLRTADSVARSADASDAARAAAYYQLGKTLEEIRQLLNQEIGAHGKALGLEASLLISEMTAAAHPLRSAKTTGHYLADLTPFRRALSLDANAAFATDARFSILKAQFYDSLGDDPRHPLDQTLDELREMIELGERLLHEADARIDLEEVRFILAIHYVQALELPQSAGINPLPRLAELLTEFRTLYPASMKLLTLEALSPGMNR